MIQILMGLLGLGPTIASVLNRLSDAKIALAQASTDQERIEREAQVKSLQAQADALKTDGVAPYVRLLFAVPIILWQWKAVVWDKLIMQGAGSTDPLGGTLEYIAMMVIGFYFVHWTVGAFRK